MVPEPKDEAYYNSIAPGYDRLHGAEQLEKVRLALELLETDPEIKLDKDLILFDVGCGSGISTTMAVGYYVGLDPSLTLLKIANSKRLDLLNQSSNIIKTDEHHAGTKHLGHIRGIAEELPVKNKACDIIFAITTVHNFKDISRGIFELRRVTRTRAIITVLKKSDKRNLIYKEIKDNFQVLNTAENPFDDFYYLKPIDAF